MKKEIEKKILPVKNANISLGTKEVNSPQELKH